MSRRTIGVLVALLALPLAVQTKAAAQDAQLSIQEEYTGFLRGNHEVPQLNSDASGTFRVRVKSDRTGLRIWIRLHEALGITQAHFHCGAAGTNGPVVAFLFGFDAAGVAVDGDYLVRGGLLEGSKIIPQDPPSAPCSVTINNIESLYNAMRQGQVYINVHSQANPAGEVRGQVFSSQMITEN